MGIFGYLKPKGDAAPAQTQSEMTEKSAGTAGLSTPRPAFASHGGSAFTSGSATPIGSRPTSLYPVGDFRNSQAEDINEIKCDVMVNWLYQQQMELLWTAGGYDEGVILKKNRTQYASCPADLDTEQHGLFRAVEQLNVRVSVMFNARLTLWLTRSSAR